MDATTAKIEGIIVGSTLQAIRQSAFIVGSILQAIRQSALPLNTKNVSNHIFSQSPLSTVLESESIVFI